MQICFVLSFSFLTASEATLLNLRISGRRSFIHMWCVILAALPLLFIVDDYQHSIEENIKRAAHLQAISPYMFLSMFFVGFLHGTLPAKSSELYASILCCNALFILRCIILDVRLNNHVFVAMGLSCSIIPTLSSFYIAQQMVADTNCIGAWRKVIRKVW